MEIELPEKLEEIKNNPKKYIKSIIMDVIVIIVSFAYIFYQLLSFELSDLNPWLLFVQSIMAIICGVTIKQSLGENGFSRGYNSDTWQEEEAKYNDACTNAVQYMDRTTNYYIIRELEKKARYRRQKLQSVRLRYTDWFNDKGYFIGEEDYKTIKIKNKDGKMVNKYDKKQIKAINKCLKVKIYTLNLFSEYNISVDQDTKPEETDKRKRTKNISKNTLAATFVAIMGVYFIPVLKWNIAAFIAATFQVAMWILFGIMQMYDNYSFVVRERVAILKAKKEEIGAFTANAAKGMYLTNPFADEELNLDIPEVKEISLPDEENNL